MIAPVTNTPMSLDEARMWARIGVLAALAVVIGWVETFIPLPLPIAGVKLGLANIVVLVALVMMGPRPAALVALVKVLATGILFGNPLMMLFSAAGTLLAYLAMVVLVRIPGLHIAVVSVVAAMLHNVGQLAVAQVVLGTPLVWYSAPFMLLTACVTGALCGFAAKWTLDVLDDTLPNTPDSTRSFDDAGSMPNTRQALEDTNAVS